MSIRDIFQTERAQSALSQDALLHLNQVINGLGQIVRGHKDAPIIAEACLQNLTTAMESLLALLAPKP